MAAANCAAASHFSTPCCVSISGVMPVSCVIMDGSFRPSDRRMNTSISDSMPPGVTLAAASSMISSFLQSMPVVSVSSTTMRSNFSNRESSISSPHADILQENAGKSKNGTHMLR